MRRAVIDEGDMLQQIYSLLSGSVEESGREAAGLGESLDAHTFPNYSSFFKLKLNPSSRHRVPFWSLFWLIRCRGSESHGSNSGLIPRQRDGPVEG